MLYDKFKNKEFSESVFKNPGSEFRGAPFWAWNSALDPEVLKEQVDIFKEMGFGGFHMHVRQGLETPYLSDAFLDAVEACTQRAEENSMLAYLYDEDRWPSGYAGGIVTKTVKYRNKGLSMTCKRANDACYDWHDAVETARPVFLAAYSIDVDEDGYMKSYRRVSEDEDCENKRYFYCVTARRTEPRWNFQTYVDTLSKEAINEFINVTHEKFKARIGTKFGKVVPSIFSDEPEAGFIKMLKNGHSTDTASVPWTWDFAETFEKSAGFDIVEKLPEIFFKTRDGSDKKTKYYYHRHHTDRFCEAYTHNIGNWCEKNGLMMTGHLMCEDNLADITRVATDPMLSYYGMQLPGIDVLCDRRLFVTAKQCDSIVHQMGKCGAMSELYGVTNWDFDFRGHKAQGDWQACLGITLRVPHLAWQTMKGEGKRDYPASIFYQSPWYKQYKIIEDHFARVNTVLTRGKSANRIAVLHPLESYWHKSASEAESHYECDELNQNFMELCNWLLLNSVNFDYISESTIPMLVEQAGAPLKVGIMEYDTVIVDSCDNLRRSTIDILKAFRAAGGNLIISGEAPHMSFGEESEAAKALAASASAIIPHSKSAVLSAIADIRDTVIKNADGSITENVIYNRRTEGDTDWLFVCHANAPELYHLPCAQKLEITVKGLYRANLYDTVSGDILPIKYRAAGNVTKIYGEIFDFDSLLIRLDKISEEEEFDYSAPAYERIPVFSEKCVKHRTEEKNPLLLDIAEWSIDGEELNAAEEMLRIDETVRKRFGMPLKRARFAQPWTMASAPEDHEIYLRFTFESEIEYCGAELAVENLSKTNITFNGEPVDNASTGYYVDKEIKTCKLPPVKCGKNVLELRIPFGVRTDIENCFILGDFGTVYAGTDARIIAKPSTVRYGNAAAQGLAFYGGNLIYDTEFTLDEDATVQFEISYYRGALVKVEVDGEELGYVWKSPFRLNSEKLSAGTHKVSYTVYGNRYNTFAALHNIRADAKENYLGSNFWRSEGFEWSYEYNTRPFGILKAPEIYKLK